MASSAASSSSVARTVSASPQSCIVAQGEAGAMLPPRQAILSSVGAKLALAQAA